MAYSKRACWNRVGGPNKEMLSLIMSIINFLLDISQKKCSYFERFFNFSKIVQKSFNIIMLQPLLGVT